MEPIWIISIIAVAVLTIGVLAFALFRKRRMRREADLVQKLRDRFPGASVLKTSEKPYEYVIETPSSILLVKMIWMNPQTELIITNPDFWCLNDNPRSWGRSSNPVLVPGISAFRHAEVETGKKLLKIAVVYPGCTNISRYLNECEVEIVKPTTDIQGVRVIRLADLDHIFPELEKK